MWIYHKMAEIRKMHLTISKGMKLYCTVVEAVEDLIVVSLKHKAKEYKGILLDSSERHLPPGLSFKEGSSIVKTEGEGASCSGADGPDQAQPKEIQGVTLLSRYSYIKDPAKYNEQPLPNISIKSSRGKQVRNIRLRPRQTLCSKCKAAIHDSKSKSPNKAPKQEGQEQEAHPHNTRYRAALSSKPSDMPNIIPGPTLRSGLRNKRADSTPKVLLENIRPKREVKPTAKKREADAAQRSKLCETAARKNNVFEERTIASSDSLGAGVSKLDSGRISETVFDIKEEESAHVILERSVSLDNPTALGQYNKQPVVRLDKSAINNVNVRPEGKEEKQGKAPTISIVNLRSTPAIKISYGGAGDRDVVKIPPRLPGAGMKSPDEQTSTADESPVPVSPAHPPSLPQKKAKKASRRTRDKQKQRYRVINDSKLTSEIHTSAIKIAGYHRKHKRKHKHRHASSEDENFNSEIDLGLPSSTPKLPAIITKLSVVPAINDLNGNEKKSDSEVLKDSSNETPTRLDELSESAARSPFETHDTVIQVKRDESNMQFTFNDDPLNLKVGSMNRLSGTTDSQSDPRCSGLGSHKDDFSDQMKTAVSDIVPTRSDVKPFEMWGSPVPASVFETEGSPTKIEAPPFQSDDSQDGLIVGPVTSLRMGNSVMKDENMSSFDSLSTSPPTAAFVSGTEDKTENELAEQEQKDHVPYGVGVFEDLTPDEDEDAHDDSNFSQPMYNIPKKPRLMFSRWSNDGMSSTSHVPGFSSKKDDSSVLFSNQSGSVYRNGPSSYFNPNVGGPSIYSNNPPANFPSSPAPRIQNSPTPIIQRSPVPIFNYNSSSRFQGSPNRRFGSSPSRRFHSVTEGGSSRQQSVIAGNLSQSRYQGHEGDQFQAPKENICNASVGYHARSEGDLSHSSSGSRYPNKFDSQSARRYPVSEKDSRSRYPYQTDSSVSRLSSTSSDDNNLGSKSQGAAEKSSLQYMWPSGDSGSLTRFSIPSNGSSSVVVPQYTSQGGSNALPHYSTHTTEGSLPSQYPSLGSTDSRFQPHRETRFKVHTTTSIPSSPPLSFHSSSLGTSDLGSGSVYPEEKKNRTLSGPHYETVDTSALFMTHSISHKPMTSSETIPRFHNEPSSAPPSQNAVPKIQNTECAKSSSVFSASPEQTSPALFFHQNTKLLSGTGSGTPSQNVLITGQGQSSSSITRHSSSSSLSQGHQNVSLSGSEDDSDCATPGFDPASGISNSQDISHVPMMKIQTQNLLRCFTENRREINIGDVQWGKVQGFPWWPCRVVSIKLTQRDHREQAPIVTQLCHVSWFGSLTVSDLHPSELRPFREEFSKHHMKKKRGPYHLAVQQALAATESCLPSLDVSHTQAQAPISHHPSLMHDLVS